MQLCVYELWIKFPSLDSIKLSTKTVEEPVSLVPGRYEAVRDDLNRFLHQVRSLRQENEDDQAFVDALGTAFYDMKISEVLVGIECEDVRDLSDLVFAVLFIMLSEEPLTDVHRFETILLTVYFVQECSTYPSKISMSALQSIKMILNQSSLAKAILPRILERSEICLMTQSPYFDKSGVVYSSTPKTHHNLEQGCLTSRHAYFRNGKVEDETGKVILDIPTIQDPGLRQRLTAIAQELDNIIPPPAPELGSMEIAKPKKKRPRNPRGVSQIKRLSYSLTSPAEAADDLLQDLLER